MLARELLDDGVKVVVGQTPDLVATVAVTHQPKHRRDLPRGQGVLGRLRVL